jgi:hypothetical protein
LGEGGLTAKNALIESMFSHPEMPQSDPAGGPHAKGAKSAKDRMFCVASLANFA